MKSLLRTSCLGIAALFTALNLLAADAGPIKPAGKDGKPLNLDFENGTLKDWTAVGQAFEKQPIRGDTVSPRRGDMKSNHQGDYWIGTYEVAGDKAKGTLTSVPFKVTHPWASFLIAGGNQPGTRVELATANDHKVFLKVSGYDSEQLRPVLVDLQQQLGKEIFIRLVDDETGGWGHINFDDFEFYDQKPQLANALDPAKIAADEMPPADVIKFAGLSPEDAAKEMTLPPGFKAHLFAGEPDVKQPIAFAIDHRGRIWVAEAYTYPIPAPEGQGKDRILVFEDTNGDGKFDKRTVFIEGLNLVSGLEVGFGGVWVGAAPYLMYIPIQDGDEPKPAGKPQILLDGWGHQDTHETLNTFTWGPDGWLYGCHGVFTFSNVGKPGAPNSERIPMTAGVWRYHPTKHIFERFSEGTSNPWGVDFDEHGQCFIEACVIPHLWHMIQGARYERQGGQHVNPYIYDDIKTIADHLHYGGNKGPHAANGRAGAMGGGHAHAGLMVYQGDSWPEEYRGGLFMNNIHGARINMDIPERQGSGFVGHHHPDFINFNDSWSQILNLQYDQDGSVYMIDWYDKNQCHHNDPNGHDRSNGRIFKIVYGDTKTTPVNLEKLSDEELVKLVTSKKEWMSRHARRILQERGLKPDAQKALVKILNHDSNPAHELRALWALQAAGTLDEKTVLALLKSKDEYIRAWSIQALCENDNISDAGLKAFTTLAQSDKSPVVRLYIASALQRIPVEKRWDIVAALNQHNEDANDHNLPLMNWYAAEPLATKDITRALALAEESKLPRILHFTVRRVAAIGTPQAFAEITKTLEKVNTDGKRLDILNGLSLALKGQRTAPMPQGWEAVESKLNQTANAEVRAQLQSLSLTFGSAGALASLRRTLVDGGADANARKTALDSLLSSRDSGLAPVLQQLLTDANLQGSALRGLAAYDDPRTPVAILTIYPNLTGTHRRDALNTLASRVTYAKALLVSVEQGTVPVKDLTADLVRNLRNLKDADLAQQVQKVWGVNRDSSADKKAEIEKYKKVYHAGGSQPGDASRGRAVFTRTCAQCHTLFDTGGKVGPDLTGSNRGDLDYILLNIVDPNAVIPNDYRAANIDTKDDRSITGIIKQQDDKSITVVTANEVITIPRNEVKSLNQSEFSMMPEGLLQSLNDQEVRDLIYYLSRPGQVPLPAPVETPADPAKFFNKKDLSGWDGDMQLWRVENGEIVGHTDTGLKHNTFLKSTVAVDNFRLVLKMKLTPNKENSGIQFRSERFGDYEMKGMQADAGAGWWGKLYEENGRAILCDTKGDQFVNQDDWNTYEILAVDGKIKTAINGHLCVDVDDNKVARHGIFGLQMHAGGPLEVRFKDLQLELNPKFEMTTVK
ncbi:PVC-type heme-binding CxxCH protein [Pedosphaera parvula]|uniref:Membrane-bound dehydrogenase domain protein n=1 Tax=Pedosphaera parvula (strain Ellin514) TaxID=320771 RepID=B9XEK6_PEDPL|nr:PVC-type heme-binding CxxCH protein [Pedosphaera parvula]EEF61720.1 membrane-bound dehydrogenase domain protein [Pedosphaera parvula Ellin514]